VQVADEAFGEDVAELLPARPLGLGERRVPLLAH
jgi:hypothetical protein